ncbi:MAG TPA: hypothetical protein VMG08_08705 [Allosphingosinicella sp.]|nr:hypothetical protein [Allosphingosinicella sp.]
MDQATEIVLRAIIINLAKLDGGREFARGLSQNLFLAIEELIGDPVTQKEVGKFADLARHLRDQNQS